MKKVFLILALFLSISCSSDKRKKPKNLYTIEQMASFLKDLYVLETKVKALKLNEDSTKVVFSIYEKKLYEKHHMDDSTYRQSFRYYMDDIEALSKIYEIIGDSLSLEERLLHGTPDTKPETNPPDSKMPATPPSTTQEQ